MHFVHPLIYGTTIKDGFRVDIWKPYCLDSRNIIQMRAHTNNTTF